MGGNTKLSTKGQVVLPRSIRESLQWSPGTELVAEEVGGSVVLKLASPVAPTRFDEVAGSLKYDGPPVSIEDMDAAIASEVRRRHALGRY